MIRRLGALICCVCAAALGCVALASAAEAGWLPPVAISATDGHVSAPPHVVLDSTGDATAVWSAEGQVESAYRPAGEGWETPVDLSNPEPAGEVLVGPGNGQAPTIAVDGAGDVTVIWESWAGGMTLIEAVGRPAGGAWSAPTVIGEQPTAFNPEPWVAVDSAGDAVAVWTKGGAIQSAYRPAGESWGAPIAISGGRSYVPQAAMNAGGDATVVWMHEQGGRLVVESAYRPAAGEWEAPTLVSQLGEEGGDPQIALDATGDTLVAWDGEGDGSEYVRTATRPAGGSWEAPTDVSTAGEEVQAIQDAVDADGDAIVAWSGDGRQVGEYGRARAAFRPSGGSWETPEELSAPEGNGFPQDLVFDQSGNAAIVSEREATDASSWVVEAAYRPAGGPWEAGVEISTPGDFSSDPAVVLDAPGDGTAADGDATAVWVTETRHVCSEPRGPFKEEECGTEAVEAAGYDPEGLTEVELELPPTAEVGEPVAISMSRAGLFAPVIDFGDGGSAGATRATHTYEAPGEYEVSGSGAEVLGYAASSSQTIKVVPAGTGGGAPGVPGSEGGGGSPGAPGSESGGGTPPGSESTSEANHPTSTNVPPEGPVVSSGESAAPPAGTATSSPGTAGPPPMTATAGGPPVSHACIAARTVLRHDRLRLERVGPKAHLRAAVKSARRRIAASC
jgi:hypothetical protein